MASVTYSNAKIYRYLGVDEDIPQKPQSNTLRDKILKEILERQLSTSTSLDEQTQSQRKFIRYTAEESITAKTSGLITCDDYRNVENSLNVKQTLKSCGLTDVEILVLLNESDESSALEAPEAREKRLREIEDKLLKRQNYLTALSDKPEEFSGAVPLNRHDFEEECSVIPATTEADQLTSCLVRLQPHQDESVPLDHPINHIKSLAEELFPSSLEDEAQSDVKPKKRTTTEIHLEGPSNKNERLESKFIYLSEKPQSFWDMQEIPKIVKSSPSIDKNLGISSVSTKEKCERNKVFCTVRGKSNNFTAIDQTKPFVLTLDSSDLLPLESISSNKKSIQELKCMEKFKKYNPGTPSSTLYIKNLSHKTSPRDLVSLMGHFEINDGPKIKYRILSGRMRGQAFVTFQDEETATRAFDACNGYIMHEKPLVIEYGKKQV